MLSFSSLLLMLMLVVVLTVTTEMAMSTHFFIDYIFSPFERRCLTSSSWTAVLASTVTPSRLLPRVSRPPAAGPWPPRSPQRWSANWLGRESALSTSRSRRWWGACCCLNASFPRQCVARKPRRCARKSCHQNVTKSVPCQKVKTFASFPQLLSLMTHDKSMQILSPAFH